MMANIVSDEIDGLCKELSGMGLEIHVGKHDVHPFTDSFNCFVALVILQIPLIQNKNDSSAFFKSKGTDLFVLFCKTFYGINQKEYNITFIQSFNGTIYRIIFNIFVNLGFSANTGSIKNFKMLPTIFKFAFNNVSGSTCVITNNRIF